MIPVPDDTVQQFTRALNLHALSLYQQSVISTDLAIINTMLNELFGSVDLGIGRLHAVESPNERYANALIVIFASLSPIDAPASALVDQTVTTDEEVVSDVVPAAALDVPVLDDSGDLDALGIRVAGHGGRTTDYH